MNADHINLLLRNHFPHQPTQDQETLIRRISEFLIDRDPEGIFIIKGYAGTGKTSMVGALVKILPLLGLHSVLLAPTGRAAKVLAGYSGKLALTIHKKLYRLRRKPDGSSGFVLNQNMHQKTIFLVDEASMIAGRTQTTTGGFFGGRNLLEDLLSYVAEGVNCKLIFIGDTAQLPPVNTELSPALNSEFLRRNFFSQPQSYEMTEVVRQEAESGILFNATALRNLVRKEKAQSPKFRLKGFPDMYRITGEDLEDALNDAVSNYGEEGTVVVCRSNKRANLFNQQIRVRIRWLEDELAAGDLVMVVKNNYFWLDEKSKAGFVANGDILEILKVNRIENMHGFRFADATLRLIDYPDEPELEAKLLLDPIQSESPALTPKQAEQLYQAVTEDYAYLPTKRERAVKVKNDPYYNALQIKFAYALTCHKAQGGQWPAVFIDQGYLTEEMISTEYLRWLYTAVTRATEKLYLVNFSNQFYE